MPARYNILVVDDNEATRLLIARILSEELPVAVTLAGTGADAERLADARAFDVILLDLLMPGIGGFEVLEHIRAGNGPNRATAVVVVSVLGEDKTLARCRELGADYFVVKPVLRQTMVAAVKAELAKLESREGKGKGNGDDRRDGPAAC